MTHPNQHYINGITACNRITGDERRNEPRGQEGWSLALLVTWGQHKKAQAYLDALNRVQRAFGKPDYTMPEPLSTGLTETHGDPLLRRTA